VKKICAALVALTSAIGVSWVVATPASAAACQAHQGVSTTIDWSGNCTTSTSSNRTSDLTTLIQFVLAGSAYYDGDVDGVYGPATFRAVYAFQTAVFPNDRSQWDGIVGPRTWSKLAAMPHFDVNSGAYYYFQYNGVQFLRLDVRGGGKGNWEVKASDCGNTTAYVLVNSDRHC
jgi:hypothetical protein